MVILVIFTNYNGGEFLPDMLERLARVTPPKEGWAVIAVDNASSDNSMDILERYLNRLPLTILTEHRRGKSNALNRALDYLGDRLLEAELTVFTDNDVLPVTDWLLRLQQAVRAHPECDIFGGAIEPAWIAPMPPWLADFESQFGLLYTVTNTPEGPCASSVVWGPNMAVRGPVFRTRTRFDPRYGPDGSDCYPMGSESDFLRRLEAAGHHSYFVSAARVAHLVRADQLNEDWIVGRAYRAALGSAMQGFPNHGPLRLHGVPIRLGLSLCKAGFVSLTAALSASARARRKARFKMSWHRGALAGVVARNNESKIAFAPGALRRRIVQSKPN